MQATKASNSCKHRARSEPVLAREIEGTVLGHMRFLYYDNIRIACPSLNLLTLGESLDVPLRSHKECMSVPSDAGIVATVPPSVARWFFPEGRRHPRVRATAHGKASATTAGHKTRVDLINDRTAIRDYLSDMIVPQAGAKYRA